MNTDHDVRELLERMAREPAIGPVDPDPILRRAHRRLARTVVLAFACVALLAGGAIGGANLVLSSPTVPATPNGDLPPILRDGEVMIQTFGSPEAVDPSTGDRRTILDCEDGAPIRVEDACGAIGDPALSADGRWLAYGIYCRGSCPSATGIWVTNARGDKHQLTVQSPGRDGGVGQPWAWSPQGSTLAIYVDGEASGLVTIDLQTGNRTTVASPSGGVRSLAWSPDGTEIVYAATARLESVDLESGEITELADVGGGGGIAWSPDGSRIAFDNYRGGRGRIIVMNRDGSDQHVLVEAASLQRSPFWSPDGTEIAYTMMRRDPVGDQFGHYVLEVWVIGVDGSNDTRLYQSPCCAGGGEYPVWSPDGNRIAFSPQIDGQSSAWIVVNVDGTGSPEPIDQTEVASW